MLLIVKETLENSPGDLISSILKFRRITKEVFKELSGWDEVKYINFVRGYWFVPLYRKEIPIVERALGDDSRLMKYRSFWEQKLDIWEQDLKKVIMNFGVKHLSCEDVIYVRTKIPIGLEECFPSGNFYMYRNKFSCENGYMIEYDFMGETKSIFLKFSAMSRKPEALFKELLVLADKLQEYDDPRGERMANAILSYYKRRERTNG